MEEKKAAKQREEEEKQHRKEERKRKRLEREEQQKKLAEKEKRTKELAEKRAQRGKRRGCGRGERKYGSGGQACGKDHLVSDGHFASSCDVPSCAQRGRRGAQGQGQTSVRAQTCRQDPSDSDDSLTGSSDPLSHCGRSCRSGVQHQTNSHVTQDVESSTSSDSSGSYCCPICGLPTRILWVACDSCDRWFHAECTDIDPDNFCNLHNVDWVCNDCV